MTNEFFNNAPVGEILGERAAAITVQPYKGPKYSDILQAFQAALVRVDDGSNTPRRVLADVPLRRRPALLTARDTGLHRASGCRR